MFVNAGIWKNTCDRYMWNIVNSSFLTYLTACSDWKTMFPLNVLTRSYCSDWICIFIVNTYIRQWEAGLPDVMRMPPPLWHYRCLTPLEHCWNSSMHFTVCRWWKHEEFIFMKKWRNLSLSIILTYWFSLYTV